MFYKIFKVLCRIWFGLIFRTRVVGGNVTLHPVVAPQLVDCSGVVTAPLRNAAHC